MIVHYLDSSAMLKRIVEEPESPALRAAIEDGIGGDVVYVSSALAEVEITRAARRQCLSDLDVDTALSDVRLFDIEDRVVRRACAVGEPHLRTHDAIHLATALIIDVDAIVVYDDRSAAAARAAGLAVIAPA